MGHEAMAAGEVDDSSPTKTALDALGERPGLVELFARQTFRIADGPRELVEERDAVEVLFRGFPQALLQVTIVQFP